MVVVGVTCESRNPGSVEKRPVTLEVAQSAAKPTDCDVSSVSWELQSGGMMVRVKSVVTTTRAFGKVVTGLAAGRPGFYVVRCLGRRMFGPRWN